MFSENFEKLVENSSERFVFVKNGKPAYVVLGWSEYSKMVGEKNALRELTEEELIAKINADIALWRENKEGVSEGLRSDIEKLEDVEYV